jgi:hypothetical protein
LADVQPRASDENAFLKTHGWEDYSAWHLALAHGASDETKARYALCSATSVGYTAWG